MSLLLMYITFCYGFIVGMLYEANHFDLWSKIDVSNQILLVTIIVFAPISVPILILINNRIDIT